MNKVTIFGRLVRDPEIRYAQSGEKQLCVANYTIAVNKPGADKKKNGKTEADFIDCVSFGSVGEVINKFFVKGSKILAEGRISTDSYKNKDDKTVKSVKVNVLSVEFVDNKNDKPADNPVDSDGFMNIPDSVDDDDTPFM